MKTELIKRQDAINAVVQSYNYESDRVTALQELPTVTEQEIRTKAIEEFAEKAMHEFTEFDLKHGYPTVTDCKIILRDLAERMKGERE